MRRTNIFNLNPRKKEEAILLELADNSSRMYNEINYKRRQSFFAHNFDWNTDEEYQKYKSIVGSATAQQIIIKNNEAWKSFFSLLKMYKKGKIEDKPHPPGYWKDRTRNKRILRTLIRNNLYSFDDNFLKLPFNLKLRWKGRNRWKGKQGRLEIVYDDLDNQWKAYMPVECEALHQPKGNKKAFVDPGVINLISAWIEGEEKADIYPGRRILSDWWYWIKQIAEHQADLEKKEKKSSRRLRKLYRKRKRRFRQAVNTIIARFLKRCYDKGVSEIVISDVTHIRESGSRGRKTNSMINNFWSFGYMYERLRVTTENYGIKMRKKEENGTSKTCCLCGEEHRDGRRYRGLYICKKYGIALNADVNGVANIANPIFPKPVRDRDNWVVAHPLLHRIGVGTSVL